MRGDDRRHLRVRPLADELELVVLVELLEDVRLELAILRDRLDQLLALIVGGRLDEIGDLSRVQVRELAMGEAQAGAWARGPTNGSMSAQSRNGRSATIAAQRARQRAAQPRA